MIKYLALPKSFGIGNFQITFYSLFILTGAILALLIGMYRIKKLGYDPHRLENVFLIAFPSGLVGARLWYIICQFGSEFLPVFKQDGFFAGLGNLFGITSSGIQISGLAIEGGVVLGILAGVIFVMKRRKEMRPLDIADCVIPGILLAQAIGRWGNFFNQEVYGKVVDPSGWSWLGNWFVNQMTIDGGFRQPLFLIESLINIGGFLFLTFVLGKWLKKYLTPGTVSFSYFIWYGTVRAILEPLRDPEFIMTGYISVSTSIVFIIIGVIGIALLYSYRFYFKKKFKLHIFDKKISPNVYVDFATNNYNDQDNNIIEKPDFVNTEIRPENEEVKEEKEEKEEDKQEKPMKNRPGKKIKVGHNKKENTDDK